MQIKGAEEAERAVLELASRTVCGHETRKYIAEHQVHPERDSHPRGNIREEPGDGPEAIAGSGVRVRSGVKDESRHALREC